ncbi:MAG: FHA domain-containing protein, partial [Planctomycetota bacterium]|nr:FHA domain-containing protein [Planctomycetota bacterium]
MTDTLRIRLRNAETTDLGEQVREFTEPAIIGRSRDADLLLLDPGVSRRHAKLLSGDMGEWFVEDLHSTRGTKVNGRRLEPGEMVSLEAGDLVEINPWSFLVLDENRATTGVLLDESGEDGTIEDAVANPMLQARFEGLMEAVRRTAGWTGDEEVFAAMLDSLLAASDLERGMLLWIEGDETRAMSIRARRRDEERQPRGFSRTLVAAALEREGTVRMEAHPDIAGGQSLVMSGAGEAFCRRVANDEEGVELALYGDRVTC